MTNNDFLNAAPRVRLGVSLTREEKKGLRHRFGASHAVRISRSLKGWRCGTCDCHKLVWATFDMRDGKCPLGG